MRLDVILPCMSSNFLHDSCSHCQVDDCKLVYFAVENQLDDDDDCERLHDVMGNSKADYQ